MKVVLEKDDKISDYESIRRKKKVLIIKKTKSKEESLKINDQKDDNERR